MPQNKVKTPQKSTPRKRFPPRQNDYVIVNKPSGYCPKCRKFVPAEGVLCIECHAFWHFACAEVTNEVLEVEWSDKEFLCAKHRCHNALELPTNSEEPVSIRVRVNSYTLHPQSTVNKLLSSLKTQSKIYPKDHNQQYYVKLCLPTFEILVANLLDLGKQWGITIKNGGVDSAGNTVDTNFNMELRTNSGLNVQTSVNCHTTQSSIHIQLNKGTKGDSGWEEKVACLSNFMYNILENVIRQIEKSENFEALKEYMRVQLTNLKGQITVPAGGKPQAVGKLPLVCLPTKAVNVCTPPTIDVTSNNVDASISCQPNCQVLHEKPILKATLFCDLDESNEDDPQDQSQSSSDKQEENLSNNDDKNSQAVTTQAPASNVIVAHETADPLISKHPEASCQCQTHLQDSVESLRIALKGKTDEVSKLRTENKICKQLQKDLDEKSKEIEEKVEKISKIMKNNEHLGSVISKLKEDLSTVKSEVSTHVSKIEEHEETIKQQRKTISDLNIRTECNKDVAMLFMDEVLDDDEDGEEKTEGDTKAKDQIAKLFRELEDEREKVSQLSLSKQEASSEIAGLKLLMEEAESKNKKEISCKDREIKSLKNELQRLETSQAEMAEQCKISQQEVSDTNNKFGEKAKEMGTLVAKIFRLESAVEDAKAKALNDTTLLHEAKEAQTKIAYEKDSLRDELDNLIETNKSLAADIDTQKKKFSSLYLKWESSKAELSALKEKVKLTQLPNRDERDNSGEIHSVVEPGEEDLAPPASSVHVSHHVGNLCFTEFLGKCSRSSAVCKFSHDITPEMKTDANLITRITNAKEEKAAKCVNEFMKKGSCKKKKLCRFSHNISDDHRSDLSLRAIMTARYQQLTGHSVITSSDSYQRGSLSNGDQSRNQEEGPENNGSVQSHTQWNCGSDTNLNSNGFQHWEQQTFHREPQPLMSIQTTPPNNLPKPPMSPQALSSTNAETVILLHSLLSQLLTKQTNGQYTSQNCCF